MNQVAVLFDQFQTSVQEEEARRWHEEMNRQKKRIGYVKGERKAEAIQLHNEAVDRLNELNQGVNELRRLYADWRAASIK